MSDTTVRQTAWQLLGKCFHAEQYSNIALDTALSRGDFSPSDRGLLTALVYGVLERRITLDYQIESLSAHGADKLNLPTKNLLRMGLYQLAYLDRIPDHAAVNETVALAPRRTRGFVNAILRAFLRRDKEILLPDAKSDPIGYLSVRYSFSPEICARFRLDFGMERTEELLAAFCKQPPMTLRVNTLKISRDAFLARLEEAGISAAPTVESRSGVLLRSMPVAAIPGFDEGEFFVQDEASQLAVEALDLSPDMTFLDACACPGSKSFGAAIEMQNRGRIVSCDLHQNKLSLVTRSAERLGINIIEAIARDAREQNSAWVGGFDRVLCDVPCSGLGVFAKKPELRYKNPADSAGLPAIQLAIAESASAYVKAGGRMVYSTCTLLPAENRENVDRFLAKHPEFELLRDRTLTPDVDGTDGFYFAVLRRI